MSLLWRNRELRIGLAPERVFVSGGASLELDNPDGGWQAAVQALPGMVKGKSGLASVVLADQFVRYALLAHNDALRRADDWSALARHRFMLLHGARADEWEVKVGETAPHGPRLACAVDKALVHSLAEVFVKSGLRLVRVQPFLVAAFNRLRGRVGQGSCWVVVEETGRLTLALIQRGTWLAVRARRFGPEWRKLLGEILERETAFLCLSQPVTRVLVCAQGEHPVELHEHWRAEAVSYRELALARQ